MALDGSCMDVADESANAKFLATRAPHAARVPSRRRAYWAWRSAARTRW